MDTKWKSVISFAAFIIGISLLLESILGAFTILRYRDYSWKSLYEKDYQNTSEFRNTMSNQLQKFVAMAIANPEKELQQNYNTNTYSDIRNSNNYITSIAISENPAVEIGEYNGYYDPEFYNSYPYYQFSKEKADKIHEAIKVNKNILYIITKDGKEIYSNRENMSLDGPNKVLPQGYNFLMYFDGNQVTIVKDGNEIDVYKDGYYDGNNDWEVPGYFNYILDEEIKNVTVCIAAIEAPIRYINMPDGYYNDIYWIDSNIESDLNKMTSQMYKGIIGITCLILSIIFYRYKKKADQAIAKFTGKLWFECKTILVLIPIYYGLRFIFYQSDFYNWYAWNQEVYKFESIYWREGLSIYFRAFSSYPVVILTFFWIAYFTINDFCYNKAIWNHGLVGYLLGIYQLKKNSLSIGRKIVQKYLIIFVIELSMAFGFILFWKNFLGMSFSEFFIILLFLFLLFSIKTLYIKGNTLLFRDMDMLAEQIEKVYSGDLVGEFPKSNDNIIENALENLSNIQKGMKEAVEEQTKSERMKVELIANVSHDIKTPLTSIISYIELLRQEEELPDYIKDYIEILENKSQRLKTMIQDVFEISKAASRQLPVHMEYLDFSKLLRQTLADMEEEINKSSITMKAEIPVEPITIYADGQRLYRVFQNLIVNALKYSLEGSRVYLTLATEGNGENFFAAASIKNTSRFEICDNIDYTERFLRGDESRTDGGSGLGLSIAQSFTEACNGRFEIETIADLFIVKVTFPYAIEKEINIIKEDTINEDSDLENRITE